MVAKVASARRKPRQQTVVPRLAVRALLAETPVRQLRGMGGKLGEQVATALPQVEFVADLAGVGREEARLRMPLRLRTLGASAPSATRARALRPR